MMIIDCAGKELYRVRDDQRYSNASFKNFGNGIFRVDRPTRGVGIRDITAVGGYRVIETFPAGNQTDASIRELSVDNIVARSLQRGFARIGQNSSGGTINKVEATGTVHNQDIPAGIAFMNSAHNFTVSNCTMRNFRMELGAGIYWNGDGYSAEEQNYGLRFLNCAAFGCTDGGFDLKSTGTFLDQCVAGENKYNFRFWSAIQAWTLTSINPRRGGGTGGYGHISITGRPGLEITIERLVASSDNTAPLFTVHSGTVRVIIGSYDLKLPPRTPLVAGNGNIQLVWRSGAPVI